VFRLAPVALASGPTLVRARVGGVVRRRALVLRRAAGGAELGRRSGLHLAVGADLRRQPRQPDRPNRRRRIEGGLVPAGLAEPHPGRAPPRPNPHLLETLTSHDTRRPGPVTPGAPCCPRPEFWRCVRPLTPRR